MKIKLQKACSCGDCEKIHAMQVKSFKPLLNKYGDIRTNPGAESLEKITDRMKQDFSDYYFIQLYDQKIGAIRIVRLNDNIFRISPMFLLQEFKGKGFAQQTIKAVEQLYPQAEGWEIDTIKEETKLCYLYEKMGYKRTGKEEIVQNDLTIVY